jgi:hypothetical protein
MNTTELDFDIDQSRDNKDDIRIIERIIAKVEENYLFGRVDKDERELVENVLLYIEGVIVDIRENKRYRNTQRNSLIYGINTKLLNILEIYIFKNDIVILYKDLLFYVKSIEHLSSRGPFNFQNQSLLDFGSFIPHIYGYHSLDSIFGNNIISDHHSIIKALLSASQLGGDTSLFSNQICRVEIYISQNPNHQSFYLIWLLLEILHNIKGVSYEIEDLTRGSIRAKVIVLFANLMAKKEMQDVVTSLQNKLHGTLNKEHFENQKNSSESDKLKAEAEKIKHSTEIEKSEQTTHSRELDVKIKEEALRKIKLENDNLELQNEKLAFDNHKAKMDYLIDLLAKEIINVDQFRLAIDGKLVIEKDGANINIIPLAS